MPRCPRCEKHVRSDELWLVGHLDGKTLIACPYCSGPKLVEGGMAEKKRLVTVEVDEYKTKDGAVDHSISLRGSIGGLTVQFDTTVDQVRAFFQEKRKQGEAAKLTS